MYPYNFYLSPKKYIEKWYLDFLIQKMGEQTKKKKKVKKTEAGRANGRVVEPEDPAAPRSSKWGTHRRGSRGRPAGPWRAAAGGRRVGGGEQSREG